MTAPRCLVVAKAPVPGRVKTRLGTAIGMAAAAELAAAALLDTLVLARATYGVERCVCALDGCLDAAPKGPELSRALDGWTVIGQVGDTLGERLGHAFAACGPGPVVQIGMDTPQLRAEDLLGLSRLLDGYDAALGPAADGGWWGLALRDPHDGAALAEVPMSTPTTGLATREALRRRHLRLGEGVTVRDVDLVEDAEAVATTAPDSRFAAAWRHLSEGGLW